MLSDTLSTHAPASANPEITFRAEIMPMLTGSIMRRTALRFCNGDESATEDLLQSTSLRAWKYRGSYKPGTNARAWLSTIMRNAFLSSKAKRREVLAQDFRCEGDGVEDGFLDLASTLTDDTYKPEDAIDAAIEREAATKAIEQALSTMAPVFRDTWLAFERDHLSYIEIAAQMGVEMGTVMSRLHRARAQMKTAFLEGDGLTYAEIAERLGMRVPALVDKLHAA